MNLVVHTLKSGSENCRRDRGFSLIEVVLALSITVFAVLSILGLLGQALHVNRESEDRIQAANLATKILAEYRAALNGTGQTPVPTPPVNLPALNSVTAATTPPAASAPAAITAQGTTASSLMDPSAAYALSYIIWKNDKLTATTSPYSLVNCTLTFQWPPRAVGGNSANKQVDTFEVTTSFLVKN